MTLIDCQNVSLAYDGRPVLSQLSFQVQSGDYLCIVGENGSGKSTLVKSLLGLHRPSKGSIRMGEGLRHQEIGYLPQQSPIQQDFPASVFEVVLSGCLNSNGMCPFFPAAAKERAKATIHKLALDSLAKKSFQELSGGQRQRVLLARALCATKKLLLLDEPTAGLDPLVTHDMYNLVEQLNKEDGITIIMVSHDILGTISYATHVLHLAGKPLFFGSSQDYLQSQIGRSFAGGDAQC